MGGAKRQGGSVIYISPEEFRMAEKLIKSGFEESKLLGATGSVIQFYYWEWNLHWGSYHDHGQGD